MKSIEEVTNDWFPPILIVSKRVGMGNVSVGKAIEEKLFNKGAVHHLIIEDLLPPKAVEEDLIRYRFIANNFPFLLTLIYRIPLFYYRKLLREKILRSTHLDTLKEKIESLGIKSVIGISHRPTFWLSVLKKRYGLDFALCGVLTEFGRTLGWKYIFWEVVDGYLAYFDKDSLDYDFAPQLKYYKIEPPCRKVFYEVAKNSGDKNKVVFIAGYWGQVFCAKALKIINQLLKELPHLHIIAICGTNEKLFRKLTSSFGNNPRVEIYGKVDSIAGFLKQCASIITKPGFSTIVEAHVARRPIFLLKGMPVAEDHNASYAIKYFGAQWFSKAGFKVWHRSNHESR